MKIKINVLFVIGNGFDRHHGMKTNYNHFSEYFELKHPEKYEQAFYYYPSLQDSKGSFWNEFEKELGEVDYEQILDDNIAYLGSPLSDEFRDRDWHDFSYEIGNLVNVIKSLVNQAFEIWVRSIRINKNKKSDFDYSSNQFFISFNYTKTLTSLYNIPSKAIWYIHGESGMNKPLIFGHGKKYKFEYNENSDMAYIFGEKEIERYFNETRKDTRKIIRENAKYFKRFKQVEKVYVLGHSLNDIDLPYFIKIKKSIPETAVWHVSYHSYGDKVNLTSVLEKMEVEYKLIQIKDVFK